MDRRRSQGGCEIDPKRSFSDTRVRMEGPVEVHALMVEQVEKYEWLEELA
jgi:hypothetical protein